MVKNSFAVMKNYNLERVYHTILNQHPISRIDIADKVGLNKMTVTNCVKNLMEAGLVHEVEQEASELGGRLYFWNCVANWEYLSA